MLVNDSFKMDEISKSRPRVDKHIHGISKLDGNVYPYDWDSKRMKESNNLESCSSEKHLVNFLLRGVIVDVERHPDSGDGTLNNLG